MPAVTIPQFLLDDIGNGLVGKEELLEVRVPTFNENFIRDYEHYDLEKFLGMDLPGRIRILRIRTENAGEKLPPDAIPRMRFVGTDEDFENYYESINRRWKTRFVILFEFRDNDDLDPEELLQNK